MITRFQIAGFKTIRKADLEFGRVNLFIGGNGAGKSNLLEALGILSAALKDISDIELQKRGVRLSVPTLFKSAFRNTDLRSTFDLHAHFERDVKYHLSIKSGTTVDGLRFFSERIEHANRTVMGRSQAGIRVQGVPATRKDVDPTRGIWDRFKELAALPDDLEDELERMARYAIYAPQTAFLRGTEVESLPVQPMGLSGGGLAQAAQIVLQTARRSPASSRALYSRVLDLVQVPGWSRAFRVSSFQPEITTRLVKTGESSLYFVDRFMKETRNVLSAYDSSEGTLYLLFMAVLLLHPSAPKLFALDNVDNALNPAITKRLIETLIDCTCTDIFRSNNLGPDQVFLTSHNPTSLDAFDLFREDQRVFVVHRDGTGASSIQRLKPTQGMNRADWVKQSGGKSLSELWIEGKIKGALGL